MREAAEIEREGLCVSQVAWRGSVREKEGEEMRRRGWGWNADTLRELMGVGWG